MARRIRSILKSDGFAAVFFILAGICFLFFPGLTVSFICKVIFGIMLIISGIYQLALYATDNVRSTVLDMFSGVIILVLGIFLFTNPQLVISLLPRLLGALILAGCIWVVRSIRFLIKMEDGFWKIIIPALVAAAAAGCITIWNPFEREEDTLLFIGITLLVKGITDLIFYIVIRTKQKAYKPEGFPDGVYKEEDGKEKQEGGQDAIDTVMKPALPDHNENES